MPTGSNACTVSWPMIEPSAPKLTTLNKWEGEMGCNQTQPNLGASNEKNGSFNTTYGNTRLFCLNV